MGDSLMYVLDCKKKLIAKFNPHELAYFLNNKIKHNRFYLCANKSDAKKYIISTEKKGKK